MRTTTDVIDQAIKENRIPEYLLYGFAIVILLTGEYLIGWSVYYHYPFGALGGVAMNGLVWPAYNETKRIRKENLLLRTLEIALGKAETSKEAATILTEVFAQHFQAEKPATLASGAK